MPRFPDAKMLTLPNIVIRASAGTGKTYRLATRFIQLLDLEADPASILAATFTRKAAGEILERILSMLATATLQPGKLAELAIAIQSPSLHVDRCRELLVLVTQNLHRLQIGTLDSFFARLASSFSLELGLPPGWRILEDLESTRLREEAIEALLEISDDRDFVNLLRQLTQGSATRSVNDLILDKVESSHEVALATPLSAWQRVPRATLPTADQIRSLQQDLIDLSMSVGSPFEKPIRKDADLAQREDWETMLKSGLLPKLLAGETIFNRKPIEEPVLSIYKRLLAQIKAILLNRWAWQNEAIFDLLQRFDREYRALQRRSGGCTFSDVTRSLVRRSSSSVTGTTAGEEPAAFRLDSRLSHLLLDEFQDTSPQQWNVLRPLARQIVAGPRAIASRASDTRDRLSPSFFCVGDVKQAIYGWRGGDARIFDMLQADLTGLTEEPLNESRRSAQPIIDTVNQVFRQMARHPQLKRAKTGVQKWSDEFPKHTTFKKELKGYVELRTVRAANTEDGETPKEVTLHEAAQRIAELAARHPTRSIGVLTRSNAAVARLIYELQRLHVSASEEGGNPLTDSAFVQVILSLLRLTDHPGDSIARCHVALSPLGPVVSLTDLQSTTQAAEVALRIRRQFLVDGYGPTLLSWVKELETACSPRDRLRLQQLVEQAFAFQPPSPLRTRHFIEQIESVRIADPSSHPVRVMTVHQSKGLQFDIVVLPQLDEKLLGMEPTLVSGETDGESPEPFVAVNRGEEIRQLLPKALQRVFDRAIDRRTDEALCVLYVALTRAVHAMHLLIAPSDKAPTESFAGLLRAALASQDDAPAETELFHAGQSDWDDQGSSTTIAEPAASPEVSTHTQHAPLAGVRFAASLNVPTQGWQTVSPSRGATPRQLSLGDELARQDSRARDVGILFHRWFEEIEWLDAGVPSRDALLRAARALPPLSITAEDHVARFLTLLTKPFLNDLLSRGNDSVLEPTVLREHPLAVRLDSELLVGRIDRLVLWKQAGRVVRADVLDFKTSGQGTTQSPSNERQAKDRQQIETYCDALSRELRLARDKVSGRLIYVDAELIIGVR